MAFDRRTSIGIIGAGRLGSSLAAALVAAGYNVVVIASRDRASATRLADGLGHGVVAATPRNAADRADAIFLAVPDAAVAPLAASLRWRRGQAAIHCSGALALDVFEFAVGSGAVPGCFHPLQSFPSRTAAPGRFRGITIGMEASLPLSAFLERLARDLGAEPLSLAGADRALYHAAAVFASNDVVALMAAASRAWQLAGLPAERARLALAPLLAGASANIAGHELADALTGPVARGDAATVEKHLVALETDPTLRDLYVALGRELLRLVPGHEPGTRARLAELFDAPGGA